MSEREQIVDYLRWWAADQEAISRGEATMPDQDYFAHRAATLMDAAASLANFEDRQWAKDQAA